MSLRPVLRLHDCCRVRKELSLRMDDDSKANQTSSKHGFSILLQWRYYIYNPREGGGKVSPSSLTAQQVRRCSHRLINSVFAFISASIVRFDSAMGHIAQ